MPYDPHTISLEAELSTLAEHPSSLSNPSEDVCAQTMVLGSVALVGSPQYQTPDGPLGANPTGLSRWLER